MSGFLYAIKRSQGDSPPSDMNSPILNQVLVEAGLDHIKDMSRSVFNTVINHGTTSPVWVYAPKGYNAKAQEAKCTIDYQKQRWEDFGKFFLGAWTVGGYMTSLPTPCDLERKELYWSAGFPLGDGQVWRLPIVPVDLPIVMRIVNNEPKMVPDVKYGDLVDVACRYWDLRKIIIPCRDQLKRLSQSIKECEQVYHVEMEKNSPNQTELDRCVESIAKYNAESDDVIKKLHVEEKIEVQQAKDCCLVLSKNYHVGLFELSFLGVLNSRAIDTIIMYSFMDRDAIEQQELAEKKGSTPQENTGTISGSVV